MTEERTFGPLYRNGAGSAALITGIIAIVCAFVPFIGDFVAIPFGIAAVVCGWIGVSRVDDEIATNYRESVIGASLGGAALFFVFLGFAATFM